MNNTQQSQKNYYDNTLPKHQRYQSYLVYTKYLTKKLIEFCQKNRINMLEVGCGQGRFTMELARFTKRLTAIDISKTAVIQTQNNAKKYIQNNISVKVRDVLTLGNSLQDKYDHIVGFFILHHLPRPKYQNMVKQFIKILDKNSKLVFLEPNRFCPFYLIQIAMDKDMKWEYEKGTFTPFLEDFAKACDREGLKRVSKVRFGFLPPFVMNRFPKLLFLDRIVERIPILNIILCPFMVIGYMKV